MSTPFKGVKGDPDPSITVLDEIAMVINEHGFRREPGEGSYPWLKPEMKAVADLIRQRAAQGDWTPEIMIGYAATLVIDAMVSQNLCDLRLAAHSLPPFERKRSS